jgi:hypothetical protein
MKEIDSGALLVLDIREGKLKEDLSAFREESFHAFRLGDYRI